MYYRKPRENWERDLATLPAGLKQTISKAIRIAKEVTRFRYRLIDLPELERKIKKIKNM